MKPASTPTDPARIFARSEWIWPYDLRWDLHNAYALFRRDFTLDRVPRHAPLFITADQSYHLYLNGAFVGRGPARGFQSHWPYDEIDVARWLVPGRNVLAVRAYNPGASNFQYVHQGYAGLLVAATWGGGRLRTDRDWQCLPQPGIRRDMVHSSLQLFPQEHFDARACPTDWMNSDFDDSKWTKPNSQALNVLPWASLEPRGIPLMFEVADRPGRIIGTREGECAAGWETARNLYQLRQSEDHTHAPVELGALDTPAEPGAPAGLFAAGFEVPATGPGRFRSYLLDVGRPVVGNYSLSIGGGRGGETVDFAYTEGIDPLTLKPDLRFPDGSSVAFSGRVICRSGRTEYMFYHPYGFRHVTVTVRNTSGPLHLSLCLRRTGYPVERRGAFRSSEPLLEKIWETCAWSQQNCMLDAYVDTPWREQAQWWGDARVQAWNTFHLSGDARLFRRGIYQIGAQHTADGLTYGHAPTMAHNCVLPDFTLVWMLTQWDYYWQTGDLQPFKDQRAGIERALAYFEAHTGRDGLVTYDPRYWLFLDWTELPKDGASSIYNLWLVLALERLAAMHRLSRDTKAALRCERWAKRLRAKLRTFLNRRGLLGDGLDAKGRVLRSTSPHAQTLALMAGLAPEAEPAMENFLVDYLADESGHTAKPSAYWINYVYSLLAARGHGAKVVAHIRPRWEPMIAYGSTFEIFGDSALFAASRSHAWSAHPLYQLMQIIGGVRQIAPAWKRIRFSPEFVGETGGATIPTPQGPIVSDWRREDGVVRVELTLPRGVTAEVRLPGLKPEKISGCRTWTVTPW
ncbi:MAG: alpha-L-rhamnosidase N-terminal domain-containing protein [Opitutaceae bacterium]|nr:alpha-L-rhamnosidase N-terminal domain-containing protein [Opitutaceae bacterium]